MRQRILDVTATLVLEKGIDGVSLRQIADEVGVKAGSLYYHFTSKDQLVETIFQQGIDVMMAAFDQAANESRGQSSHARLAAHVRAHLGALFENGPYTAAHVTAFRTAAPEVHATIVPHRDAYEARWTALLDEFAADGAIAASTPIGLSRLTLFGAMNTSVEWFDTQRGNLDELSEVISQQFWKGVAA